MATYIVGDLQGCLTELDTLLNEVAFRPSQDTLWLTGDLVARGPDSLGCLRRVIALGNAATTVLGNHDLHLLAVANGINRANPADKIGPILQARDSQDLLYWLRHQPLLAEFTPSSPPAQPTATANRPQVESFVMSHAGIPPQWSIEQARSAARFVEAQLRSPHYKERLAQMYGNSPAFWTEDLGEIEQLRFAINAFTRMRLCYADGRLDFDNKSTLSAAPRHLSPWFKLRQDRQDPPLIFGHWAALEGECQVPDIYALDTGCVWGGSMTLLCWETGERISSPCPVYA
ncbi:symmetrical bis(5'-nucleosyl)-tetraphosphatase [Oceanisphaera avium]|uniref:Bis(5'-nucleosyl)-tetraphosphatase, symmetrical n=1 Tax=Oceanisphaera avium TaxID=1903694 RepID=A0A1Y0CXB9_9GAMM|nr:symmetrical bis(5'-nucleosyl)-tetraphosphatase [Oceanisphaera avium]ART79939.1 bis(5'-nucleosyl)-tetraphosphatase (symmetrical) [Oceanisphaera avium]